jgi:hypothetical protein
MAGSARLAVQALGSTIAAAGAVGLWLAYFTVPRFLPEYGPGIAITAVLLLAGVLLLTTASSGGAGWARRLRSAAVIAVVGATAASVYSGVATRLWIQAVIQFS